MKVRILSLISDEVRRYEAGEVVELPDDKAARFIKDGHAVADDEAKKAAPLEGAALADAPERATLPPAQKRGAP